MSKILAEGEKTLPGINNITQHIEAILSSGKPSIRLRLTHALVWAALIAIAIPALTARSQDEPATQNGDSVEYAEGIELAPVVIMGDEIESEREVENPSKFMTVIDVSGAENKVETVSEVLNETVGVQVKNWSGMGGFSTVSIRGSSASQVQVYLDGVPLNRASTGITNLEDLPLDSVEYIEVFRGFTPADFGSAGIGGAVNLVTKKDMEGGSASVSYGSWNTWEATAHAAAPTGPANVMVYGGYGSSDGNFEYENDNGTPSNKSDDFTDTRKNNDYENWDLAIRSVGDAGEWTVTGIATGHFKDQGLPGIQASQAERARLNTRRTTFNLSGRNRALAGGAIDLTVGADGLWEDQLFEDPDGELGTGGPRKTQNIMSTAAARSKVTWYFGLDSSLTGYAELRQETYQPVELIPDLSRGKEQKRTSLAGVVSAELTDPTGVWTVQATLRHETYWNEIQGDPNFAWTGAGGDNKDTLQLTSPSIGIMNRVSDTLVLKANAGRFYRVPTFYELFGDRGVAVGNTDLDPEKGVNWDAGFTWRGHDKGPITRPYLEYAFFQSRIEDMIIFFQNSQRTIMATNIGGALIAGHEVSFSFSLFDDLTLSGNYTYQSAVDRGEVPYWYNNQLPFRPMHEAYLRAAYKPVQRVDSWAEANYISENYWDRANLYKVDERTLYNAGLTVDVLKKESVTASVTVEGKNLSDERAADVAGYPLPGRSGYVTLRVKW